MYLHKQNHICLLTSCRVIIAFIIVLHLHGTYYMVLQVDSNGRPLGLLIVYICTHTAQIRKANKRLNGSYALAVDSSWKSNESLASTSLSIAELGSLIAAVNVSQKVIILDGVHVARDAYYGDTHKTRVLYPHSDMYQQLAQV
jgi:hypothetical protein